MLKVWDAVCDWASQLLPRFLFWLTDRLVCRIIKGPDGEPYMERYVLLELNNRAAVYLHRFIGSDPGRDLHNHPNDGFSIVLLGQYMEQRLQCTEGEARIMRTVSSAFSERAYFSELDMRVEERKVRWFNWIPANTFHRINIDWWDSGDVWSLFMRGPKKQSWAFIKRTVHSPTYTLWEVTPHDHQDAPINPDPDYYGNKRGWQRRGEGDALAHH